MSEHFIEESNLSIAWGKALKTASLPGRTEFAPLVVSITGFDQSGNVVENNEIRTSLDQALATNGKQSVETVANTIFPYRMWNKNAPRTQLFSRYNLALQRIRTASGLNKHGIYFERMITGGPAAHANQLEFVIQAYNSRNTVRRSMLQIGIFLPSEDITTAAQRGFPCLQHVTFAPVNGELTVNAFYANQYLFQKGYGNYLGLCRLGQFVAQEMGLRLTRVTCYLGIASLDCNKSDIKATLEIVDRLTNQ